MDILTNPDWAAMFLPSTPVLEIIVRGTAMYLAIFGLVRFVLRRTAGVIDLPDLLLVVLVADAAQNGMADDYHSIADGVLVVAVITFWSFALDWLSFKFRAVERLIHSPPSLLVKDGRILWDTMRRYMISREELMTQVREQGLESVSQVKLAHLEGDGRISIVGREIKAQGTRKEDGGIT